ncbi:hypothetical protein BHM03_00012093 [Ensete ventricosum]|nr:hypothetical protein BHM03_00012093 [Ensete ventricosum]
MSFGGVRGESIGVETLWAEVLGVDVGRLTTFPGGVWSSANIIPEYREVGSHLRTRGAEVEGLPQESTVGTTGFDLNMQDHLSGIQSSEKAGGRCSARDIMVVKDLPPYPAGPEDDVDTDVVKARQDQFGSEIIHGAPSSSGCGS